MAQSSLFFPGIEILSDKYGKYVHLKFEIISPWNFYSIIQRSYSVCCIYSLYSPLSFALQHPICSDKSWSSWHDTMEDHIIYICMLFKYVAWWGFFHFLSNTSFYMFSHFFKAVECFGWGCTAQQILLSPCCLMQWGIFSQLLH